MRFVINSCSTKLSVLTPAQIFSGDIPFQDISCWSSLRRNVVKDAMRPAKPQLQGDIGREFDDKLWSLIEECWAQEPSNRPTAETVSLRLGGANGCLVNPAEMYKKEIAILTEELTRVKLRSEATRQDLEKELAKLRNSLERRELELKKELDEERDLRKQVEKNADERIKAVRQDFETEVRKRVEKNAGERIEAVRRDFETELAKLRDSLTRRELEQAELKKDLDEERELRKQVEFIANKRSKAARQDLETEIAHLPMAIVQKPIVQVESLSIPNGIYIIKNRIKNLYWITLPMFLMGQEPMVYFWVTERRDSEVKDDNDAKVNEHSPIIQCSEDNCLSKWKIIPDANGNIFISHLKPSLAHINKSWAGAGGLITGTKVPWRLIPADDKFY